MSKRTLPKVDAAHTIDKWLAPLVQRRRAAITISKCKVEVEMLQSALVGIASCTSVGDAQNILMKGSVVKAIETILRAFARPNHFHMQLTQQARLMVTAVLITHFPDEILMGSTGDNEEEEGTQSDIYLQEESRKCVHDARVTASCLQSLVQCALSAPQRITPYSTSLSVVLKLFSASFDSWRRADKLRTVAKLEETFMQTYAVYLGALNGRDSDGDRNSNGPSRTELVVATQQQLEKIRHALEQVLGKHAAASKVEEICAAVEAALYTAATSAGGQANSADSAASTPLPSPLPRVSSAGAQPPKPPAVPSPPTSSPGSLEHPASSASEASALAPAQQRILDKLAGLSGIHQERLAYEMVLNPYYRLPPLSNPLTLETFLPRSSSTSSNLAAEGETSPRGQQTLAASMAVLQTQTAASVAETLKARMLRVLGDKMVNSLRRSTITSPDQITVGQEVPLYFMPNGASVEVHTAGTGSAHFTFTRTPILTARVLAVRRTNSGELPARPPSRSASPALGRAPSPTPRVSPFAELSIDVEYVGDGVREDGVSGERIVLADAAVPDPTPLVVALQDLAQQIAAFTPNRPDIQQEVLASVDAALLSQMIVNRALDPVNDLLPILQFFQRSLQSLQAPSRTQVTDAWIRSLAESFHKVDNAVAPPGTAVSSGHRRGKSIDEVAPLLPVFFERASTVVEEIQRDMANYYISVLVPVLQQYGHEFLKEKFQQRLLRGQVSLDATASLIYSQLTPTENFKACVKDLIEAGVCSEAGFALADVLAATTSSAQAPTQHNASSAEATNPSSGAATATTAASSPHSNLIGAIVARSMLSALQLPFRLNTPEAMGVVPETLVWDASRLAAMRDLVDRIALECSLVIACKQVLARYQLPPWCGDSASEVELQHRLDVLLTEKDTSMGSIAAEVVRYVLEALHKFRQAHLAATTNGAVVLPGVSPRTLAAVPASHPALVGGDSQEVHERVTKALKDVVAEGNPVLQLFSKRVYKVLLRAMLGQGFKHLLPSYSLHSPAQQRNLSQLVQSVCRLYTHTMRIHRDVYTVVIGRAVASANEAAKL